MRQPRDEERERREQEARWLVARDGTYDGPPLVEQERDGEWPIARPLEWP